MLYKTVQVESGGTVQAERGTLLSKEKSERISAKLKRFRSRFSDCFFLLLVILQVTFNSKQPCFLQQFFSGRHSFVIG